MGQFVRPETYWVGYTETNDCEILRYLKDSGNDEFWESVQAARQNGLSNAEILCSMFAKLCYKSLSLGKNANISRVRDIESNIRGSFDHGHGSVFEHVGFNFVIRDCSRVFTHELVRHRIGTAFSQNSGRYIRLDNIDLVWDPILAGCETIVGQHLQATEDLVYKMECQKGLRVPPPRFPDCEATAYLDRRNSNDPNAAELKWVVNEGKDLNFDIKKKITSAIRRVAPNGQSNEIGFSVNLRSLRHTVMMRTGRHSEWEIRVVFEQLYFLLKEKYPTIFHGAVENIIDGVTEVSGMKMQPYEKTAEVLLSEMSTEQLEAELSRRRG